MTTSIEDGHIPAILGGYGIPATAERESFGGRSNHLGQSDPITYIYAMSALRCSIIFLVVALAWTMPLWPVQAAGLPTEKAMVQDAPMSAAEGLWLVEDGSAVIEFIRCGATLCGRIYWSKDLETEAPGESRDINNPKPALRERPICGLTIVEGLVREGPSHWGGGMVYNPDDGLTYGAEMRLADGGKLRFRGFLALPFLGSSQIWTRPAKTPPRCALPSQDNAAPVPHIAAHAKDETALRDPRQISLN